MRPALLARAAVQLLGAASLSLAAGTVGAVTVVTTVPAYGALYSTGIDALDSKTAVTFGALTSENTFGRAVATVGTAPSPFVSLDVTSTDASLGAHDAQAAAQLGYYVAVAGPSGADVPVWLSASGSITHSEININISAQLKVINDTTTDTLLAKDLCYLSKTCGTTGGDSFSVTNMPVTLRVGHRYYVSLVSQATASTNGGGSGYGTVHLDPTFVIDPTFADAGAFSLVFSDGIVAAPVPEPSTWAMLVAGLAMVGVGTLKSRCRNDA